MMPKRLALLPPTQPIKELIGPGLFRFVPADSMADQKLVFARNDDYVPCKEPPVWASGGKVVKIDRLEMIASPTRRCSWTRCWHARWITSSACRPT